MGPQIMGKVRGEEVLNLYHTQVAQVTRMVYLFFQEDNSYVDWRH